MILLLVSKIVIIFHTLQEGSWIGTGACDGDGACDCKIIMITMTLCPRCRMMKSTLEKIVT